MSKKATRNKITAKIVSLLIVFTMILPMLCTIELTAGAAVTENTGWSRDTYYSDSIAKFAGYDLSDPNYISDADFFGTWDGTAWTKEPYFDYERYPALSAVEAAAKNGDYAECKSELLSYYKARYATYTKITNDIAQNPSDETLIGYEKVLDNFTGSAFGRFVLADEAGWTGTDITKHLNSKKSATGKKPMYLLAAANRDGYKAEIDSIEGENKPFIEAVINGETVTFNPIKDTYTNGEKKLGFMSQANTAHNTKTSLVVEESTTDASSKSAFMQFDFSSLKSTDTITSARLYIYGKRSEGASTSNPTSSSQAFKAIYLLPFDKDPNMDLNTMTFNKYKNYRAHSSLDGELYKTLAADDSAGTINGNNVGVIGGGKNMTEAYEGYLATGDETFAYHALRILLACIRDNGNLETRVARDAYTDTTNSTRWRSMAFNTSADARNTPTMLKFLINSDYMTPEIFTTIMKYEHDSAEVLVKCWGDKEELNNWGGYNCQGLQYYSMFFPEFKNAHAPSGELSDSENPGSLQGGWIKVEQHRREYKSINNFAEDGSCNELSIEYTAENIQTLLSPLEIAPLVNADLGEIYPQDMVDRLEKAIEQLIIRTNPNFGEWQVGDASPYGQTYGVKFTNFLKLVNDNPLINYFVTYRAQGSAPDFLSYANDTYPRVNFRNSWEANAVAGQLVNTSAAGGSHGHHDDLSLVVAAYGQYLLVDPMQNQYDVSEMKERWLSSTRGHNTVEINDTGAKGYKYYHTITDSETGAEVTTDYFGNTHKLPIEQNATVRGSIFPENRELNSVYDYVKAQTHGYEDNNALEDDFKVIRDTLFMHKGYFIVTDYIEPTDKTAVNKYKQPWHFIPTAKASIDTSKYTVQTNISNKANIVVATVKDDAISEPYLTDGLYTQNRVNFDIAPYGVFEQNKAGIATFNTILYPTDKGKTADIVTTKLATDLGDDKANAFKATITDESSNVTNLTYYNLFDEASKTDAAFGDYTANASLALVEEEAANKTVVLRNGTSIKATDDSCYLIYSNSEITDIAVEWDGDNIYITSSDITDLSSITVYGGLTAKTVYLNGTEVASAAYGRYIYFGSDPVIDDSEYVIDVPAAMSTSRSMKLAENPYNSTPQYYKGTFISGFDGGVIDVTDSVINDTLYLSYPEYQQLKDKSDAHIDDFFIEFDREGDYIEYQFSSGVAANTFKYLDLSVRGLNTIDKYKIETYANWSQKWTTVKEGSLKKDYTDAEIEANKNIAFSYPLYFDKAQIKCDKIRFTIISYGTEGGSAQISEAYLGKDSSVNYSKKGVVSEILKNSAYTSLNRSSRRDTKSRFIADNYMSKDSKGWHWTNQKGFWRCCETLDGIPYLIPDGNGKCWYSVSTVAKQGLNEVVTNIYSGTVTEFEVFSTDDSTAFKKPDSESWVSRGKVQGTFTSDNPGKFTLYGNTEARYWLVKINSYDGDLKLNPFELNFGVIDDNALSLAGHKALDEIYTGDISNGLNLAAEYDTYSASWEAKSDLIDIATGLITPKATEAEKLWVSVTDDIKTESFSRDVAVSALDTKLFEGELTAGAVIPYYAAFDGMNDDAKAVFAIYQGDVLIDVQTAPIALTTNDGSLIYKADFTVPDINLTEASVKAFIWNYSNIKPLTASKELN